MLRLEVRDVLGRFDEVDLAGSAFAVPLAERAFDFGVAGMPDQHDVAAGLGVAGDFDVHLRYQRASRVEHAQVPSTRLGAHR
jgi:hypothetical protein